MSPLVCTLPNKVTFLYTAYMDKRRAFMQNN